MAEHGEERISGDGGGHDRPRGKTCQSNFIQNLIAFSKITMKLISAMV